MHRIISTIVAGGLAAGLLVSAGCFGDNLPSATQEFDAGLVVETDATASELDAGIDGTAATLAPCLDRPTDLPYPPSGQLPCELLPPEFGK